MKSYDEIANRIFERRDRYVAEQKRKKKMIIQVASATCSLTIVVFLGIGVWKFGWLDSISSTTPNDFTINNEQSNTDQNTQGNKAYPYEDKIQYLPKEMLVTKFDNGFLAYNQEKNVDSNILNLYAVLYDNSQLHRDCHPIYADDGSVSFSRKSSYPDTDENRYKEIQNYLGENNNLFYSLSALPQNLSKSIRCLLMQNGKDTKTTAVSAEIGVYENCVLDVIISHDFDSVNDDSVKSRINNMRNLLNSKTASQIDGKVLAINYVYQTRYCAEKNLDEERYIYYAFFQQNGDEYLIQFTTNYTLAGSDKNAYGVSGRTQDECKQIFEEIIQKIV